MGAYHGKTSFLTFSHSKSVLHRDYNPIAEMLAKYVPLSPLSAIRQQFCTFVDLAYFFSPIAFSPRTHICHLICRNRFPPSNNRKEVILTQLLKTRNLPTDSLPYLMVFSLGIAVTVFWQLILGQTP